MSDITDETTGKAAADFMSQLTAGLPSPNAIKNQADEATPDELKKQIAGVIETGISIMDELQSRILSGADAKEVEASGKFMAGLASVFEALSKFHIQDKDIDAKKEIQEQKHKHKLTEIEHSQSQKLRGGGDSAGDSSNTIVIATREEVLERILAKADSLARSEKPAKVREMEPKKKGPPILEISESES